METEKNSVQEFALTVVTPISGEQSDFSMMQATLKTSYGLPIKFRYIIDTPNKKRAEQIQKFLSLPHSSQPEFQVADLSAPGLVRNLGLHGLQTKWVAFWDSDDAPDVVEFLKMIDTADKNRFEVCLGEYAVVDDHTKKFVFKSTTPKTFPELGKCLGMNPGLWRFGFKSLLINSIEFCELSMAEDQLFLAGLELETLPVYVSNNIVYRYHLGDKGHLTENSKALRQLPIASLRLLQHLDKSSNLAGCFNVFMLSRQILTAIKKAPVRSKFDAIVLALRIVLFKKKLRSQLLLSILYIMLHSREFIDDAA